jgi:hypothetical protein
MQTLRKQDAAEEERERGCLLDNHGILKNFHAGALSSDRRCVFRAIATCDPLRDFADVKGFHTYRNGVASSH